MLRPPPGVSEEVTSVDPLAPGHPNGNGNFGWAPLDESSESSEVGQTDRQTGLTTFVLLESLYLENPMLSVAFAGTNPASTIQPHQLTQAEWLPLSSPLVFFFILC
jgi:hypothetical protein